MAKIRCEIWQGTNDEGWHWSIVDVRPDVDRIFCNSIASFDTEQGRETTFGKCGMGWSQHTLQSPYRNLAHFAITALMTERGGGIVGR